MSSELTLLSRVAYRGREITGPRLRGLLALLAHDLRTGCGTGWLVDGLWPDKQPENPAKALQVLVFRARAQLGADVIASTPTGYRLALSEEQVDASAVLLRAAASAQHLRAGDHAAALSHADDGLALWGGAGSDALADTVGDPVAALRAERLPAYRSLLRSRALALSGAGRRAEAVPLLQDLARQHPHDEEVLLELLRCLAGTAGSAAALQRYETYRRALRDELGTDPGPALQALHGQLLRGRPPAVRHGVPQDPNPLLGRDDDLAAVAARLRASRVTSIVGTGGLGKTRLAHAVSRRAEQRVVHFVALAGVTADGDVLPEVASAVGLGEPARAAPGQLLAGVVAVLGAGPVLLVLDNCEHVLRGAAELVRDLVAATGDLRVLTTSRAPLGLSSEAVYPLPELDLATAVELFGQRARAARPGVELPAGVVEQLCRHLDGLPLAVELAAARTRIMSVAEIAGGLRDRFTLLRGGARDAPERHHTLHAVVDWSWNLLTPEGRAAMRALSAFPDGFAADGARHLLDTGDPAGVLEHLADHSLLQVRDTPAGTRFRMLETVRAFSAERRDAAGETGRVLDRFLGWAREFGLAHHAPLLGADPAAAVHLVRAEQDNLVHALRLGIARDDPRTVAATAAVLAGLWAVESSHTRLTALAEAAAVLSHYRPEPPYVEAVRTASTLVTAITFVLRGPRAMRSLAVLRRLPPAPPDTGVRATAVVLRAAPQVFGPDPAALRALCDSDEPLLAGVANCVASFVAENRDDPRAALAAAERMLAVFGTQDSPWMRVLAHSRVGELCLQLDRSAEARAQFRAALRVLEALDLRIEMLQLEWAIALASLHDGAVDEAEHWLEQATGGAPDEAGGTVLLDLGVRAEILLARGEVDAGLRLWRRTVERIRNTELPAYRVESPGFTPEALEAQAAAVIAHAQHGRLDLVADTVEELPQRLTTMLTNPLARPPAYLVEFPICGALLLALGMVDAERDPASAARLIALAETFRFLRGFQPTMSASRARAAAERADRSAYHDALSSYAGLDRDGLRAAALTAVGQRAGSRL